MLAYYNLQVMPYLKSISIDEMDLVQSTDNLSPSQLTGLAVEELQEVLELQEICTYILEVHTSVEQFRACTEELLNRNGHLSLVYGLPNGGVDYDDDDEEEDGFNEEEEDGNRSSINGDPE